MNDFRMGYPAVYLALLEPEVKPSLYTPPRVRLTAAEEAERRAQDKTKFVKAAPAPIVITSEKIDWPTRALWYAARTKIFYTLFNGELLVSDLGEKWMCSCPTHSGREFVKELIPRFNFTGTDRRPPEEEIPVDAIAFYNSESPVFIRMGEHGQVQIRYSNSCTHDSWSDSGQSDWAVRQYMCTAL